MSDVWANVADLEAATQQRLAEVLETRGDDAQQRTMRQTFLDDVAFPEGARVLEVGCGTGGLTRRLASREAVASVVGVDNAPSLLERARELAAGLGAASFVEADARSLPFDDGAFDVVLFDSTPVTSPSPSEPSPRRSECCSPAEELRPSTATTRPPRWRWVTTIPSRRASTR